MIVNIHDGPWQCEAAGCRMLYTRHMGMCEVCGSRAIVKVPIRVAWGDEVGMGQAAGPALGGAPQPTKPGPCQPDPFPMQQSAALTAILESWPLHPTGGRLEDHIREVLCNVAHLCDASTRIAQQLERNRQTVTRA